MVEQYLRHYVDKEQSNWDLLLHSAMLAINNTVSSATGYAPADLVYGRLARTPPADMLLRLYHGMHTPTDDTQEERTLLTRKLAHQMQQHVLDALSNARIALQAAANRMAAMSATNRDERMFSVGERVLVSARNIRLKGCKKFLPKWIGPYPITRVVSNVAYTVHSGAVA